MCGMESSAGVTWIAILISVAMLATEHAVSEMKTDDARRIRGDGMLSAAALGSFESAGEGACTRRVLLAAGWGLAAQSRLLVSPSGSTAAAAHALAAAPLVLLRPAAAPGPLVQCLSQRKCHCPWPEIVVADMLIEATEATLKAEDLGTERVWRAEAPVLVFHMETVNQSDAARRIPAMSDAQEQGRSRSLRERMLTMVWARRSRRAAFVSMGSVRRSNDDPCDGLRVVLMRVSPRDVQKMEVRDISQQWDSLSKMLRETYRSRGAVLRVVLHIIFPGIQQSDKEGEPLKGKLGSLLSAVADSLHMRMVYHSPFDGLTHGELLENCSLSGAAGEIERGWTDLKGNNWPLQPNWEHHLTFIYPHLQDDFILLVRAAGLEHHYLALPRAFKSKTWLATAATLAAASGAWYVMHERQPIAFAATSAIFEVVSLLITGAVSRGQRRREALLSLSFGALLLGVALTAALTGRLAAPSTEPEIDRIDQVTQPRIAASKDFKQLLQQIDASDPASRLVDRLFFPLEYTWFNTFSRTARVGDIAILTSMEGTEYVVRWCSLSVEGRPLAHVVRQRVLSPLFLSFSVPRGSPLRSGVEQAVQAAVEAGLPDHWALRDEEAWVLNGTILARGPALPRAPQPLRLAHFMAAAVALGPGATVATLAFAGELLWAASGRRVLRTKKLQET